jgi:hypothetical protein
MPLKFPPAGNLKPTPDSRLTGNWMKPRLGTTPALFHSLTIHPSTHHVSASRPSRDLFFLAPEFHLPSPGFCLRNFSGKTKPNYARLYWVSLKNKAKSNPNKGIYIQCYPDCGLRFAVDIGFRIASFLINYAQNAP